MDILFLISGLIMILIFSILAYKKRHNTSKCIAYITLGVLFATFFMVLPTEWVKEGKIVEYPVFYSILSSLLYSFKALGGRQDIAQLETIGLDGILKAIYICINYIMFALSPILASSLVLSFVGDTGDKIRYFFSVPSKCYIFSEINENSVALAKGIKSKEEKKTIVFCNTKNADKDLLGEVKKLNAITLHKSCKDLKLFKRKEYEFCFLSENEDNNIELTEAFILKKESLKKYNIVINSFVQNRVNIDVLESLISKKPCAVFENANETLIKKAEDIISQSPETEIVFFNVSESDKNFKEFAQKYTEHNITSYESDWKTAELGDEFESYDINLHCLKEKVNKEGEKILEATKQGIGFDKKHLVTKWQDVPLKIRFIDEIALFCNNLLFKHPLYNLPEERKDIFVLLVGCGRLGTQMLKTVSWCGQVEGYTLKIRVLDKEAKSIEKEIKSNYPELKLYDIDFEEVDIETPDFKNAIKSYSDATFVCVATGSDDLNITTAEKIHCILRRNYSGFMPQIFTRIRKIEKTNNFNEKGTFLAERNIGLFGTASSIFSDDTLFNSKLESLAFAVHLCYNGALDKQKDSFEYQKALHNFYTSEYSRRSSMAAALHISSKLRACGILSKEALPAEAELIDFKEKLNKKKDALIENEHERWNAFMRSEGFCGADFETVKKYAPITRSHKDEVAKLHPCIVSWEKLDEIQEKYNELQKELNLKKSDFKEYDKKIVAEIPEIVKKANQLCEEGW